MQPSNVSSAERTRRRAKGAGSVIRRRDGTYEARYRGKSALAKTEREAEARLTQLIAGTYQPRRHRALHPAFTSSQPTLNQFIPRYLAQCRLHSVSEETIRGNYTPSLGRFADTLGPLPLRAITPEDVSAALLGLLDTHAPGTVKMARAALKRCLALAEEWDLIDRNPVRGRAPKVVPKKQPRVTTARAKAILAAVEGSRVHGPVTLGLYLGLRIGEVLGLRWEDIDEDRLVVRGQYLRSRTYKPRTKSGQERELLLVGPVREAFRRAKQQQEEDRSAQRNAQTTGFVFTGPKGRPMARSGVYWTLDHRLEAAGVPRTTFHGLRHMTATLLHDLGVSEEVRRSILGHTDAEVHRRYVHVDPETQRTALDALERALA